jgi:hypothetical protein
MGGTVTDRPKEHEPDLQRAWRESREGFAAAADIIDRWVAAWSEAQDRNRELEARVAEQRGLVRDLTTALENRNNELAGWQSRLSEANREANEVRERLDAAERERDHERQLRVNADLARKVAEAETERRFGIGGELVIARKERDAARAALAEAVGIGPGSNDGPWTHCKDCGRRMVWQYPVNVDAGEPGCPAWTCPNCVVVRVCAARAALAELAPVVRAAIRWGEDKHVTPEHFDALHAAVAALSPEARAAVEGEKKEETT